MDYGPALIGVAAIITATGSTMINLLILYRTGRIGDKVTEIHTLTNSNLTEARDATTGRNQQADALLRSNELLSQVIEALVAQGRRPEES